MRLLYSNIFCTERRDLRTKKINKNVTLKQLWSAGSSRFEIKISVKPASLHRRRILRRRLLKQPSHDKLNVANSCWQTQVGACERHNNSWQTCWKLATHVCQSFTRQIRVYQHEKVCEKVGENRDKFYLSPTVCQQDMFANCLSCEGRLKINNVSKKYFISMWGTNAYQIAG